MQEQDEEQAGASSHLAREELPGMGFCQFHHSWPLLEVEEYGTSLSCASATFGAPSWSRFVHPLLCSSTLEAGRDPRCTSASSYKNQAGALPSSLRRSPSSTLILIFASLLPYYNRPRRGPKRSPKRLNPAHLSSRLPSARQSQLSPQCGGCCCLEMKSTMRRTSCKK